MLEIVFAEYGNKDVTEIVKSYINLTYLSMYVSNQILGDPLPNRKKYLKIDYKLKGVKKTITFEEGDMASINEPGISDGSYVYNSSYDKSRIKIVSNSKYDDLYNHSKSFYNDLEFEKICISGKTGMYGMSFFDHVIRTRDDIDWMIYIDEDCFITDTEAMLDLLYYQIEKGYGFCGMPDGGVISHRFHNPISVNAFFTIINIRDIKEKYRKVSNVQSHYDKDLNRHIPHHLIKNNMPYDEKFERTIEKGYKPYGVSYDNFEPYYNLFFWMLRNGKKPLYLDAYDSPIDDVTTVLKNHEGRDFAYHTWFARFWRDKKHKARIENVVQYSRKLVEKNDNYDRVEVKANRGDGIDVIIPYMAKPKSRVTNLMFIIRYYRKYLKNANIILVEQNGYTNEADTWVDKHLSVNLNENLFCKSYLFNEGFNISTGKYLILADADCVIDTEVLTGWDKYKEKFARYTIPHTQVYYLTKAQTERFINEDMTLRGNADTLEIEQHIHTSGGIAIVTADSYRKVEGLKNHYIGWGGEDDFMYNSSASTKGVGSARLDFNILHLWHERESYRNYTKEEMDVKKNNMPKTRLAKYDFYE